MNFPIQISTRFTKLLSDTVTPVSIYLRIRDVFPNSLLLESADYHHRDESMSYICCDPVASIELLGGRIRETYPGGQRKEYPLAPGALSEKLQAFSELFQPDPSVQFPFITGGLFGYLSYDAVPYFEKIVLHNTVEPGRKVPEMIYSVYRTVLAIQHFNHEMVILQHRFGPSDTKPAMEMEELVSLIFHKNVPFFPFFVRGSESSNFSDEEYLDRVRAVKKHIHRGDIFQMQLSRRFSQAFGGDDFNVYRALRSINPSPYLFYFDFGNFKILGSSPEAQLLIHENKAQILPIAGTFRRSGNDPEDQRLAEKLKLDPKENSEHVMLVDLARNDLSRHCRQVSVDVYKEVQFYSHVIHLVSKVSGQLQDDSKPMDIVADTFPAGTLTGAPKFRAMELIDHFEKGSRGIYGGAIGFLGFNGDFNHAILIRSFLSKNHVLYYQAAGGIVADSVDQLEMDEVSNKLRALKTSLSMAETLTA